MNYIEFQNKFQHFTVISINEIEKAFPHFDRNALTRWQKKGYLQKIRSGFYRLTNQPLHGVLSLFFVANRIYSPSYISLHSALRWYDFIPEEVMVISSISTRKTTSFKTPLGKYIYHAIRSDLFFGYKIETFKGMNIKIADPAKTILDFLYLSPKLNSEEDFFELRLNFWEIQEKLNLTHFEKYLSLFSNKALEKRADIFIQFLEKNDVFS